MYSSLAAMITDILSIIDHLIKERIAELSPLSFCDIITFLEVKRTSERSGFFAGDLVVCKICHTNIISGSLQALNIISHIIYREHVVHRSVNYIIRPLNIPPIVGRIAFSFVVDDC